MNSESLEKNILQDFKLKNTSKRYGIAVARDTNTDSNFINYIFLEILI